MALSTKQCHSLAARERQFGLHAAGCWREHDSLVGYIVLEIGHRHVARRSYPTRTMESEVSLRPLL
jgi:hypothetical protein